MRLQGVLRACDPRVLSVVLTVLVAVVPLAGCVHGDAPYQPVQLGPAEAAIYVYRPRSLLSPGPVSVHVDQQEVVRLRRNTHAAVLVAPGEDLVRVQRRSDATRLVRLGPGESLHLEVGAALVGGQVSLNDPGLERAQARIAETLAIVPPVRLGPSGTGPGDVD